MSKRLKIFLALGLFALLFAASLLGLAYRYYADPSKLKHLAENALSGFTGTECSIREISISKNPLILKLAGIEFKEPRKGFHLHMPEVSAVMDLRGPLGRRDLILEDVRIEGFALTMAEGWGLPPIGGDREKASPGRRILGRLFSFFLWKNVTLHRAGLAGGAVSTRWGDRTITVEDLYATLTPERFLEGGCALGVVSVPEEIDFKVPRLHWVTDHPLDSEGGTIGTKVKAEDIHGTTPRGKVSRAALDAALIYTRQERTLDAASFRLISDEVALLPAEGSDALSFPFSAEGRAVLDLDKRSLAFPTLHLILGVMAEFRGESRVAFAGRQEFAVEAADLEVATESVMALLPASIKEGLKGFGVAGPVHIRGKVTGNLGQPAGLWTGDLEARLQDNGIAFSSPGLRFNAALTGEVQFKGPLTGPELDVKLALDEVRLRAGAVEFEKGRLGFSLTGAYPAFQVHEVSLHGATAAWDMGGRQILLDEIEGQTMGGSLDLRKRTFRLPDFALATSTLKNLSFSLELAEDGFSAVLKGEDVRLLEFCRAMGFLPHGWTLGGTESLQAEVHVHKDRGLTSGGTLRFHDLSFESEDGNFLGEGLSLVLAPVLEGKIETRGRLRAAMSASARKGEILYDRFYLDLGKHPLVLSAKGSAQGRSLDVDELRTHLEELVMVNLEGSFTRDGSRDSRFRVHVPRAPLAPIFRQFIVEPYQHQNPSLTDLHLQGLFSLDLEVRANSTHQTVKGRSRWEEGQAALGEQRVLLQGIDLDLPIWYGRATKGTDPKALSQPEPQELEGSLFIESAQLPLLPAQLIRTGLKAGPEGLRTLSPVSIETRGGEIEIGRVLLREPFSGTPGLETNLAFKEIDLDPWLSALWPRPVAGTVQGTLDPVRWEGGTLSTQGEITAHLFEGSVVISNVGASRFPSLTPVIALDAVWNGLDLAQITGDTAFGKVQGNLRGHAMGLEIADGQPQAFDLLLETVKQRDTPQRISVQAVDNIARIGGGASPFGGLAGSFLSFFRELPYEKIGIRAILENDLFRINGTIVENDREYLIKKGGFSGVDVIIGSPGSNTISFKDMVRRIKRVTGSQEGPVIE